MPERENHITEVVENVEVSVGVWHITVKAPKLAETALPGQFVQVLVEGAGLLLRRPLGIAGANVEQGTVELFTGFSVREPVSSPNIEWGTASPSLALWDTVLISLTAEY